MNSKNYKDVITAALVLMVLASVGCATPKNSTVELYTTLHHADLTKAKKEFIEREKMVKSYQEDMYLEHIMVGPRGEMTSPGYIAWGDLYEMKKEKGDMPFIHKLWQLMAHYSKFRDHPVHQIEVRHTLASLEETSMYVNGPLTDAYLARLQMMTPMREGTSFAYNSVKGKLVRCQDPAPSK